MRLQNNCIISLSFPHSEPSLMSPLVLFKIHDLCFHCHYIHICIYLCVCIYNFLIHIYRKYNLFRLDNATCVYMVFGPPFDDHWITSWCIRSCGRLCLPRSAFPRTWVGLRPPELSPICITISISVVLVQLMIKHARWSCGWSFCHFLETYSHSKPCSSGSCTLSAPISGCFLSLGYRCCFVDGSFGTELHSSWFWLLVAFWYELSLLQREVPLRGEDYTYLSVSVRTHI